MRYSPKAALHSSVLSAIVVLTLSSIALPALASDPVSVVISPLSAQVSTGSQQQFVATVSGTTNKSVSWTIIGSGCSGSTCGTIAANGLYTAPATIPSSPVVLVTATSQQDPTKSSTAVVTIIAHIQVSVRPAIAEILVGGHQQFTAVVTGTANTVVQWSVAGAGCRGASCGVITSSGVYTAPPVAPNPPLVTVIATSAADPSKSGSAAVTVTGPVSISISPKVSNVVVGSSQQFSAAIGGTTDTRVSWNVVGTGCSGAGCGTVSPQGLYFAPPTVPNPAQVFVSVTSVLDPTKSASAAVTILSPFTVTITPSSATVVTGTQLPFHATVTGLANQTVIWSLSGSGCSGAACGTISSAGTYTAPRTVPAHPVVTIKAVSVIDLSVYGLATVTIVPPISVKVTPPFASLVVGTSLQFKSIVTGTTNQNVGWSISGTGCSGRTCGTITSTGFYTAPTSVPSPPLVTVTATSRLNTSVSGSASVKVLPPVGIQVSPGGVEVVTGRQQQFTASVTGTTNTSVMWSVSGAGCARAACGIISATGLYTAPNVPPNPPQVTIEATSVADRTKSSFATVTVIAPVNLTISPASAVVAINGQVNFQANVIGSANQKVTWSLSGVGCSGTSCGTLGANGLYTAPGKIPRFGVVIVTATPQIDPSVSESAIVSVVGSNAAKLSGSFAFQFSGSDANGVHDSAGVFSTDGIGNITGHEDVNSTTGPSGSLPLTGTYSLGSDNRGVLVLNNGKVQQTFRFALNQAATQARCIEFDSSGVLSSGVFVQQDSSALSVAGLRGAFAVSLVGQDSTGARIGALSMLYFDQFGDIIGGVMNVNDNGTFQPTFISLAGSVTVDGTGHGSLQLKVPGFLGGTFNYAVYVASSGQFFLVSTDSAGSTNPILAGRAMRQEGAPYSQTSLLGGTVFNLSGVSHNAPEVRAGRLSFDGISAPWARFDENVAGAVSTGNVVTGAYAVGVNGVGLVNLDNFDGSTRDFVVYIYGPDSAFLMDSSTSAVDMGELLPQVPRTPYTTRDLLGKYVLGTGVPPGTTSTLYSGTVGFDGSSAAQGTADINQSGTLSSGQGVSGTYQITMPMFGRAAIGLTSPTNSQLVFWVIGPGEAVGLSADPSVTQPVILYLEQ